MGYIVDSSAVYGHGEKSGLPEGFGSVYGTSCKGEPTDATIFQEYSGGNGEDANVQLSSVAGSILSQFPLGIQYPKISSMKNVVNQFGPLSGELIFAEMPEVPLPDFASYKLKIDSRSVMKAYLYDTPDQTSTSKKGFSYKSYGMIKRLEGETISNSNKWTIHKIEVSGPDETDAILTLGANVNFPQNLYSADIQPDQVLYIRDTEDSDNEGKFRVVEVTGALTLRIHNPSVVLQNIILGTIEILPKEWGDPLTLVSELVDQVFKTYGQRVPILYSANLIQPTPGITTLGELYLEGMSLFKFIELVVDMLGGLWYCGVNADGFYFLEKKKSEPIDKFAVGWDYNDLDIKIDRDWVWNYIEIFAKSEEGSGTVKLYSELNESSEKKWGRRTPPGGGIEVPASFTKEIAILICRNLLELHKEPRVLITIKNAPYKFYEFGDYKIAFPAKPYYEVLDDLDSLGGWSSSDNSKLSVVLSNDTLISGSKCHKMIFTGCDEVTYSKIFNVRKNGLTDIHFYLYSSAIDDFNTNPDGMIQFYIIDSTGTKHEKSFPISIESKWIPCPWNIASLKIKQIVEVGFQFKNVPDSVIYFDELKVRSDTSITHTVPLVEVEYNNPPTKKNCKLTFGGKQTLEKYLSGYLAQIETLRYIARNR
ncbi:hypothetical protein JWG44_21735 [Leptospira sp. 201903071]|uniref:hypothetical protein n=1 Tax=Leptospira ainazelensis TaxID=2810034 RepID=UPI001963F704|nr:hypothetical protein [Leptospira ainazelensis]MBM9502878.1 hypothetical protein [Leptospira ainazelensis]